MYVETKNKKGLIETENYIYKERKLESSIWIESIPV